MKIILFLLVCYAIQLNGQNNNGTIMPCKVDYQKWILALQNEYDNLSKYKKEDFTFERFRNEISYVDEKAFIGLLDSAFNKNPVNKWTKLYYVYQYFEGEVNFCLSTYIFSSKNKIWGITYDHSKNKFYMVEKKYCKEICKFKSKMCLGSGLIFISKFDVVMNNTKNTLLIGCSNSDEFNELIKIYDKKVFNE